MLRLPNAVIASVTEYIYRIHLNGSLMRCAPCSYSLITVTSSYRICTCFPFHRSQRASMIRQNCHALLRHLTYSIFNSCANITYFYRKLNRIFSRECSFESAFHTPLRQCDISSGVPHTKPAMPLPESIPCQVGTPAPVWQRSHQYTDRR